MAFKVTSQARLLSVGSGKWGAVKARIVFAPKGFKFHGAKTIVMARDANGHIVLKVQAKGSVKHGYKVRIVGGGTHSKWLKLRGKPVALTAALSAKAGPTLTTIHG